MSSLADTALAFARECLGWEGAKPSMWGQCSNQMIVAKRGRPVVNRLRFTDIAAVLESVRHWCDRHDASLELAYHGLLPGEWEAQIVTPVSLETIVHTDPCHALMAACVEAERKLKVAA